MTEWLLVISHILLWLYVVAMGILLFAFYHVLRRFEDERQASAGGRK